MDANKGTKAVAAQIAHTWRRAAPPEAEDAVCLGAVAALALPPRELAPSEWAERVRGAGEEQIAELLDDAWHRFSCLRPELALRCGPLVRWLIEEPRSEAALAGSAVAARAAVEAGALEILLDPDRVREADLLGDLHEALQGKKAAGKRGEFYTPPRLASALADMGVGALFPGEQVVDPTAGTGAMLRAAAAELREQGRDPHELRWLACEIDPLAVACLAVNAHLWDLGPRVVLACADSVCEPEWPRRAATEQREPGSR